MPKTTTMPVSYTHLDWTGLSLQVYFTGNDQVTYSTGNNNYLADDKFPRALWTPWYGATNNTFSTSGNWQTVSIPLSEFAYDRYGNKLGGLKFENLTGMTMFLYTCLLYTSGNLVS